MIISNQLRLWLSVCRFAMSNNTTTTASSNSPRSISCYNDWGIGIATLNTISFLVNLFHLVILTRMAALKGRPCKWILVHICVADIGSALLLIMVYSCLDGYYYGMMLTAKFPIINILIRLPIHSSNWTFLVAGIEQYYSICKPLAYESSTFVSKLSVILMLVWVLCFCWSTLHLIIARFVTSSPEATTAADAVLSIASFMPLALAAVPLIFVIKELIKMRQKVLAANQQQSLRAVVYLIIICVIFLLFSLFDLVTSYIQIVSPGLMKFPAQRLRNATKPLYGTLNTVIYGFRTKAYCQEMRKLVCKRE